MFRTGILVVALGLMLSSCGMYWTDQTTPQLYSLDGVKYIAEYITNDMDPASYNQASYQVSTTQRILLRFESLDKHVSKILVTGGKKVTVDTTLVNQSQEADAIAHLKLCPITRTWMMRATWRYAHPFGANGGWSLGGELDKDGCVSPTSNSTPENKSKVLTFDMTQWFIDYPRGRNTNFGLILTSDLPIQIIGEQSGSYSPRIKFEEYPSITTDGSRT